MRTLAKSYAYVCTVLVSLLAAACFAGACGTPADQCIPGDVKECPCVGGLQGVQSCDEVGQSWDQCVCPDPGGGGSGGGGSGGGDLGGGSSSCSADQCTTYYADEDGDGWGDPANSACLCAPDWAYPITTDGDCNDANPLVHPGNQGDGCNIESPTDDDCDGAIDEDATLPCDAVSIGGGKSTPEELWYPLDHTVSETTYSGHVHSARDLPAPIGTPVYAAKTGTVTLVTNGCQNSTAPNTCGSSGCVKSPAKCTCGGGYGNRITIAGFDGSITVYAHLTPNSALVKEGDVVCAGQPIAAVGATGNVCSTNGGDGAHLHFEYRDPSGTYKDPKPLFTDRLVYRGGLAFTTAQCQALDTLNAAGLLEKNCAGYRAASTCGINRAIGAKLLGSLVQVDKLASFGQCMAACDDADPNAWYYDWVEAATRLHGQQNAVTMYNVGSKCYPGEWLYRSHFLKAAIEAADMPTAVNGPGVPDMASVPASMQPYVYGATAAGVLSSSTLLRPDWVATYGWIAPILTAMRQTQGANLYATEEDMTQCGGMGGSCPANFCNDHGSCSNNICTCATGYAGANCDACAPGYSGYPNCSQNCPANYCNGHGSCNNNMCSCSTGYAGTKCDTCAPGYTGYPNCTQSCPANYCNGHGSCSNNVCSCTTGYTGTLCDTCAPGYTGYPNCTQSCPANYCNGHGSCSNNVCSCSTGYAGMYCDTCASGYTGYPNCVLNCPANYCNGHGSCSNNFCSCSAGYAGTYCDTCASGYTGYPNCVPNCPANYCNGHGSCSNNSCSCSTGYAGTYCNTCASGYTGYPNCVPNCPANYCNGHGSCNNNNCSCSTGYAGTYCNTCASGYSGYPNCTPVCGASASWSPTSMSSTDSTGQQYSNGNPVPLAVGIRIEIAEIGTGVDLQIRACKTDNTAFSSNVYLRFEEWYTYNGLAMFDGVLAKNGSSCTNYAAMSYETNFATNQKLGGDWTLVSPNTSSSEWSWSCGKIASSPSGTCWTGATSTITRTCL